MAGKYQHTMALLPQIKEMLAQGMTQKQVDNALTNGSRWRMNCYGIFCGSQKGSEGKGQVLCHLSAPEGSSHICHVFILWCLQKQLL